MVRSLHKTKILFAMVFSFITPALAVSLTYAENPQNFDFKVNVAEVLTISITEPVNWAVGNTGDLLRNKVTVTATTNNPDGTTVSMYTNDKYPNNDPDTTLHNKVSYDSSNEATFIPTFASNSSATKANFPENFWGYSVNDVDSAEAAADYYGLKHISDPIKLFNTKDDLGTPGYGSQVVFFGAKANNNKQSGTYEKTVYFAAVTGTVNTETNPQVPTNPSGPNETPSTPIYNSTTGNTTYTTQTTNGSGATQTETTTTTVTKGDVVSAYSNPAGVTSSTSGDSNNTALVAALATGAAVSAVSGIAFFVAAKRKNDDEEG